MSGKLRSEDLRVLSFEESTSVDSQGASPADTVEPQDGNSVAIDIRNATLQYPIGPYVRGSIKANLFSLFGRREAVPRPKFVDALTNLDLSMRVGERVGIIGSNGSGKSTLLRAIAGIYPLKSGVISVAGQIGTLLDIGLGFESESTGRENIYYRGMAMGYSRRDIAAAEAEIVAFAGLGDFIDLPMRTYSSGMYVRLGFAVSTQFRPDVLLIDEVFGAGDAAFAHRALQRMLTIVQSAGIVVLATHDIGLIERLCTRVLWLNRGVVVRDGHPSSVLPQFHQFMVGQLVL
jgi:lipopolysaccharide transport system ATP-binding protein